MRVALVACDAFQNRSTGYYPPLHLCHLATGLELAGCEVRIFDYAGPFSEMGGYFRAIHDFQPEFVGLSGYTPYVDLLYRFTKVLRPYVPRAALVVGGPHPTAWPEWTLDRFRHVDYAMQGEADRSIVALAEMLAGRRPKQEVPGLVYRRQERILANPPHRIERLDELPQVQRGFLDEYYRQRLYWDMAARGAVDMMITSRGCPCDCSFCFKVDRTYRFRSVEHVMTEFESLRRRGVRSVHIQDDAFTANRQRCLEIAEALIRGKYRFELKVRSRVNAVDEELLGKLKRAGVRQIIYGFESGSQKMLDSMNKRTTVEMNRRAVDLTKRAGIACYGEILVGMPGETRETIDETIAFLLDKKPIIGSPAVLYPLPGTEVYERAKADGTLQGDWGVGEPWPWVKLPWALSALDLHAESERIARAVQRDPGTLWYFARMHLRTMSWRQLKYLARLAVRRLVG